MMTSIRLTTCHFGAALFAAAVLLAAPTKANDLVIDTLNACEADIARFCPDVPSGGGRLFACIMAHEDSLMPRCAEGVADARAQLRGLMNTMAFLGSACRAELDAFCSKVEMGEGRITSCLREHYADSGPVCKDALEAVGLHR